MGHGAGPDDDPPLLPALRSTPATLCDRGTGDGSWPWRGEIAGVQSLSIAETSPFGSGAPRARHYARRLPADEFHDRGLAEINEYPRVEPQWGPEVC